MRLLPEQKFTKPPLRYTDASLVKAMEDKGIGRPSTYASIISVLSRRKYVTKDGKYMVPTEVAYQITDLLMKYFTDIMDVGFTAKMEDQLDHIEDGGADWRKIISDFYPPFAEKLVFASNDGAEPTDIVCDKCGHPMVRKTGRYGSYLACSNYPACSNIKSEGAEISEIKCPKCGANMVVKSGKYGKFLACPNYPECSTILPFESEPSDVPCPKCGEKSQVRHEQAHRGACGHLPGLRRAHRTNEEQGRQDLLQLLQIPRLQIYELGSAHGRQMPQVRQISRQKGQNGKMLFLRLRRKRESGKRGKLTRFPFVKNISPLFFRLCRKKFK